MVEAGQQAALLQVQRRLQALLSAGQTTTSSYAPSTKRIPIIINEPICIPISVANHMIRPNARSWSDMMTPGSKKCHGIANSGNPDIFKTLLHALTTSHTAGTLPFNRRIIIDELSVRELQWLTDRWHGNTKMDRYMRVRHEQQPQRNGTIRRVEIKTPLLYSDYIDRSATDTRQFSLEIAYYIAFKRGLVSANPNVDELVEIHNVIKRNGMLQVATAVEIGDMLPDFADEDEEDEGYVPVRELERAFASVQGGGGGGGGGREGADHARDYADAEAIAEQQQQRAHDPVPIRGDTVVPRFMAFYKPFFEGNDQHNALLGFLIIILPLDPILDYGDMIQKMMSRYAARYGHDTSFRMGGIDTLRSRTVENAMSRGLDEVHKQLELCDPHHPMLKPERRDSWVELCVFYVNYMRRILEDVDSPDAGTAQFPPTIELARLRRHIKRFTTNVIESRGTGGVHSISLPEMQPKSIFSLEAALALLYYEIGEGVDDDASFSYDSYIDPNDNLILAGEPRSILSFARRLNVHVLEFERFFWCSGSPIGLRFEALPHVVGIAARFRTLSTFADKQNITNASNMAGHDRMRIVQGNSMQGGRSIAHRLPKFEDGIPEGPYEINTYDVLGSFVGVFLRYLRVVFTMEYIQWCKRRRGGVYETRAVVRRRMLQYVRREMREWYPALVDIMWTPSNIHTTAENAHLEHMASMIEERRAPAIIVGSRLRTVRGSAVDYDLATESERERGLCGYNHFQSLFMATIIYGINHLKMLPVLHFYILFLYATQQASDYILFKCHCHMCFTGPWAGGKSRLLETVAECHPTGVSTARTMRSAKSAFVESPTDGQIGISGEADSRVLGGSKSSDSDADASLRAYERDRLTAGFVGYEVFAFIKDKYGVDQRGTQRGATTSRGIEGMATNYASWFAANMASRIQIEEVPAEKVHSITDTKHDVIGAEVQASRHKKATLRFFCGVSTLIFTVLKLAQQNLLVISDAGYHVVQAHIMRAYERLGTLMYGRDRYTRVEDMVYHRARTHAVQRLVTKFYLAPPDINGIETRTGRLFSHADLIDLALDSELAISFEDTLMAHTMHLTQYEDRTTRCVFKAIAEMVGIPTARYTRTALGLHAGATPIDYELAIRQGRIVERMFMDTVENRLPFSFLTRTDGSGDHTPENLLYDLNYIFVPLSSQELASAVLGFVAGVTLDRQSLRLSIKTLMAETVPVRMWPAGVRGTALMAIAGDEDDGHFSRARRVSTISIIKEATCNRQQGLAIAWPFVFKTLMDMGSGGDHVLHPSIYLMSRNMLPRRVQTLVPSPAAASAAGDHYSMIDITEEEIATARTEFIELRRVINYGLPTSHMNEASTILEELLCGEEGDVCDSFFADLSDTAAVTTAPSEEEEGDGDGGRRRARVDAPPMTHIAESDPVAARVLTDELNTGSTTGQPTYIVYNDVSGKPVLMCDPDEYAMTMLHVAIAERRGVPYKKAPDGRWV